MSTTNHISTALSALGMNLTTYRGHDITVTSPIDGQVLTTLAEDSLASLQRKIKSASEAFETWRYVPAPKRGEFIRQFGHILRQHKEALAMIVTLECGKTLEEAKGEVQEMIDICDFAVGLSRQIGGLTLPSERPEHVMHENWHPLGPIGVISAFNFPVAVWAWNFALALICGNSVIWKPSSKTPLSAIACQHLVQETIHHCHFDVPQSISDIVLGGTDIGQALAKHPSLPLISATGSTAMGKVVAQEVAQRFGRSLLELGGNNAAILTPSANLSIALPSIVFGAIGTAGQRCTTLRRLFVHKNRYDDICNRLANSYAQLEPKIGNPLDHYTLIGPLIDKRSYEHMQEAVTIAKKDGRLLYGGERVMQKQYPNAYYVRPVLAAMPRQTEIVFKETFAPILYVMPYDDFDDALKAHNAVPQGLSSTIFTQDIKEAELFKRVSDCGIANINISTSGAEIGGAFGGEKETGGGRESGSDSWKAYMRRQTSTTYFGDQAPELAQGIVFEV